MRCVEAGELILADVELLQRIYQIVKIEPIPFDVVLADVQLNDRGREWLVPAVVLSNVVVAYSMREENCE